MTSTPSNGLHLTYVDAPDTVRIELRGDLDRHCGDVLLNAVGRVLAKSVGLRRLRLDCTDLATVDATGLSTLLMIRRRTDAADARLHLDHRPAQLDRLLKVTGTLEHLTAPEAGGHSGSTAEPRPSAASEESIPARSTSPDTSS
ncbi:MULTISPECIES: STAS domain-containing protein [unclassified Streptomyces]|uniref:STAS domain-containing protein n=1 Tax=unclassified Streptomyces TaxID=2593676 RepID=UPI0029B0F22D|nr:STAS domain-containing protein [Streptomyces sp. DK15]MDX2395088.1 STAS domain-containing protein [Streptomyces sp. DK15]